MVSQHELLARFRTEFMGLTRDDETLTLGSGRQRRRRVYLDTTATALMPHIAWDGVAHYLAAASANSHTEAHRAGRDTTRAIEDARAAVGRLVGYDPQRDVVLFAANGATGAINFLARALFPPELRTVIKHCPSGPSARMLEALCEALPQASQATVDRLVAQPKVVTTVMEHHSNLLPWMEAVGHHNLRVAGVCLPDGTLDLAHLSRILEEEHGRVRLVAVTGVSNVTGIVNDVRRIARLTHAAGAQLLVDGAQWVPHDPVAMHSGDADESIDFLVLSGHKIYAPGSRGALIGSLATLEGSCCASDVGGGMVEYVSIEDYEVKHEVTAREEAGTPNIPGSISMGLVAEVLMTIGMDTLAVAEAPLTRRLVACLAEIPGITIYGSTDVDRVPRAGVVSFAVDGIPHGLVAAYLDDFHNIAVRDGCFCAQPYVKSLLGIDDTTEKQLIEEILHGDRRNVPGLVRASLGVYSTGEDIEALCAALRELREHHAQIVPLYRAGLDGTYRLVDGTRLASTFSLADEVRRWVG
ncbi:MAG: aminotransferase class V-fold PLP-dependent enzyme [Myxococcota bacterium]